MWLSWLNAAGRALTFTPPVPFVNQQILQADGTPIEAVYKLELFGSAGTAILTAAVISKFALGMSWKTWGEAFIETVKELTLPVVTIVSVVGFAYVTNASGMSTTLGLALAMTGAMFTFFSPVLGWLGVFITGSDTSANLLFGGLQKVTALSVGMDPVLSVAANSSGGVTGKMISPQSIAVACAAVGLAGKEADLFRFTIKHSLFLLLLVCLITFLQHHLFSWMIP